MEISSLVGKTLKSVIEDDNEVIFETTTNEVYKLSHHQDCCEDVYIESIVGDLEDLVGNPILVAEESSNRDLPPVNDEYEESYTWTFYKFATIKGYVDIRWYGSSNGCYSESVTFERVK